MAFASKAGAIVPALLWVWLFAHLQAEWTLNSQYNYGWAVPFLAALIFYFRWRRAPAPSAVTEATAGPKSAIWILLLLLFPIRLVEEANPDWRFLSWFLALDVVAVSLLWIYLAGGLAWLRHFLFAFCFPLVAVPWPVRFENSVVQAMMRGVASVAVEIAGWFGVGAYQLGNVIQLRNGFVGVDEACSGVKTLQAGIMVALVLGELLQAKPLRRASLVILGCAWIFLCNIIRATVLVFLAAWSGLDTLGRWHDLIGTAALLAGMAGLLLLAWWWKKEPDFAEPSAMPGPVPPFPGQWIALVWIALAFLGTEFWYRSHERSLIEKPAWHVVPPGSAAGFKPSPIAESARVILRYDDASSAEWQKPSGVQWWMFFAHWKPRRAALQLVRSHSPEICLPAIGRTFRATRPSVAVTVREVTLDFSSYEFEQNGRPLFVFVCIQEDKRVSSDAAESSDWNVGGRLRAAWQGKRNLGQRLLEVAVLGFSDFEQASAALARTAETIVQPGKTTD